MLKPIAIFALALILTAGLFVTAQQVDAGMTQADNMADCATMCADEVNSSCVDEVKAGCDSDGMKMHEAAKKDASDCCPGMDKQDGSI
ncbi:hypothetical protein KQI63_13370 [bacterium]|nr:hypothetical protein [bacterium]